MDVQGNLSNAQLIRQRLIEPFEMLERMFRDVAELEAKASGSQAQIDTAQGELSDLSEKKLTLMVSIEKLQGQLVQAQDDFSRLSKGCDEKRKALDNELNEAINAHAISMKKLLDERSQAMADLTEFLAEVAVKKNAAQAQATKDIERMKQDTDLANQALQKAKADYASFISGLKEGRP